MGSVLKVQPRKMLVEATTTHPMRLELERLMAAALSQGLYRRWLSRCESRSSLASRVNPVLTSGLWQIEHGK